VGVLTKSTKITFIAYISQLLTRNEVLLQLNEIIVAPVTRTIRGLRIEIVTAVEDGMPVTCAVNFVHPFEQRWPEVRRALFIAFGFDQE